MPNPACFLPIALMLAPGSDSKPDIRIPTALNVVYDCYRTVGAQLTFGYTRVIRYRVVDQFGKPFYGSEVPTIKEIVTKTGGNDLVGRGAWRRGSNTNEPTVSPDGSFSDFLSANGNGPRFSISSTADQSFVAVVSGGGTFSLKVNIGAGSPTVLRNTYSRSTVTVNGTISPRPCNDGDEGSW